MWRSGELKKEKKKRRRMKKGGKRIEEGEQMTLD